MVLLRELLGYKVWKCLNDAYGIDWNQAVIIASTLWIDGMHELSVFDGSRKMVRVPVRRFTQTRDYTERTDFSDYYFAWHDAARELYYLHTEHYTIEA
jgi:hypothetical protein